MMLHDGQYLLIMVDISASLPPQQQQPQQEHQQQHREQRTTRTASNRKNDGNPSTTFLRKLRLGDPSEAVLFDQVRPQDIDQGGVDGSGAWKRWSGPDLIHGVGVQLSPW